MKHKTKFVVCADKPDEFQYSLHPEIYCVCAVCGQNVHDEELPRTKHSIFEVVYTSTSIGDFRAKFAAICANPRLHITREAAQ